MNKFISILSFSLACLSAHSATIANQFTTNSNLEARNVVTQIVAGAVSGAGYIASDSGKGSNNILRNLRAEASLNVSNNVIPIVDLTASATNSSVQLRAQIGDNSGFDLFAWRLYFDTNEFRINNTNSTGRIPFRIFRANGSVVMGYAGATNQIYGNTRVFGDLVDTNGNRYATGGAAVAISPLTADLNGAGFVITNLGSMEVTNSTGTVSNALTVWRGRGGTAYVDSNATLHIPNGSVSKPALSLGADNTGIYGNASALQFTFGGTLSASMTAGGVLLNGTTPAILFNGGTYYLKYNSLNGDGLSVTDSGGVNGTGSFTSGGLSATTISLGQGLGGDTIISRPAAGYLGVNGISSSNGIFRGNLTNNLGITMAAGAPLRIVSGTNQRAGNAIMVAGTVTVANTTVTANTVVIYCKKTSAGTLGTKVEYSVSAGVSFTIFSDSALETSTFSYLLIEVP